MHTNLVWVLDVQSLVTLNILNITVFDNKYMKLFNARTNTIHTFSLCIKQFLTGFNILETPSYFVLPPWCIKPLKIVLDQVQLKEDHTNASVYQQLFMAIKGSSRSCSQDGNHVTCDTIFHQTQLFSWDCLTQNPYLLLKFGKTLKPGAN